MALADFADYQKAQGMASLAYQDKEKFAKMSLMNISGAGIFSADRSIMDYANDIWHTKPVEFESEKPKTAKRGASATKKAGKKTK
jgi:starch phosphorylase